MNSEHHSHTRDELMERIRTNQVRMRPRAYFVLKVAALITLISLILIISILLSNLISFDLRLNGHDAFFAFGLRGIWIILLTFPWWLLVIDLALIVLLRSLLSAFSFGYKNGWLPLVFGLLLISGIAGAMLDHGTPLNDTLLRDADDQRLPSPVNALYTSVRHDPHEENGEFRGIVERVDGSRLYLSVHHEAGTSTMLIIQLPDTDDGGRFSVGDAVVVLGEMEEGFVRAYGIQLIDRNGIAPSSSSESAM